MKIKSLFILDDDPFYAQLLAAHLSKYDFNIEIFNESSACLKEMYKNPFILLLDFNLNEVGSPFTSGKEVFKRIQEAYPEVLVVMISNQESGTVVLDLIKNGIRNYIEKDADVFDNLDKVIEAHLSAFDKGE